MSESSLACVILSYNHPDLTQKAVESVLNFSWQKVYLIHNGSLKKNVEQLKTHFLGSPVEHLVLEQNRGFSGGANFGLYIALKSHPQILFLTNDCELLTRNEKPPHGLVAPLIQKRKTQHIDSFGGLFCSSTGTLSHIKTTTDFYPNKKYYVPGTAFWIHREVLEKFHGFDESLHTYWEDVDLSLRILKAQSSLIHFDKHTTLRHGIGKTCHKDTDYTTYYFQRNRIRVCWRHARIHEKINLFALSLFKYTKMFLKNSHKKEHIQKLKNAILDGWDQRNDRPVFQFPESPQ